MSRIGIALALAVVVGLGATTTADADDHRERGGHWKGEAAHATRTRGDEHGSLRGLSHRARQGDRDRRHYGWDRGRGHQKHFRHYRGRGKGHWFRHSHRRHEAYRHGHRRYRHYRHAPRYRHDGLSAYSYGIAFDIDGVTFSLRDLEVR